MTREEFKNWRRYLTPPCRFDDYVVALVIVELEFGVSTDAIFEIYRREGIVNIIDHLAATSDDDLKSLFDSYTSSTLAEQHYLTLWFYDLVTYLHEDITPAHQDLLYREVLRWMERRGVINEGEFIKLLSIQPWLKDEIIKFLNGLQYVQMMRAHYEVMADK